MERPEIAAAAQWWAEQLRDRPKQDNGDGLQSAMLTYAASQKPPLTEEQIAAFASALANVLDHYYKPEDWHPEEPIRGSALRTVSVDYGPDEYLSEAAEIAGIDLRGRLPVKTVMWVDPGGVKVSAGYGAAPLILFGKDVD